MALIISIPVETLRDPNDSASKLVRNEDAAYCDGIVCGQAFQDEDGEMIEPNPHHHVVVSGEEPKAGPRYFPIK